MSKRRTTVWIDPEVAEKLLHRFPMQGVLSWLMETAMETLLEATDGQPDMEELVRSSIRASLLRARLARRAIADAGNRANADGVSVSTI